MSSLRCGGFSSSSSRTICLQKSRTKRFLYSRVSHVESMNLPERFTTLNAPKGFCPLNSRPISESVNILVFFLTRLHASLFPCEFIQTLTVPSGESTRSDHAEQTPHTMAKAALAAILNIFAVFMFTFPFEVLTANMIPFILCSVLYLPLFQHYISCRQCAPRHPEYIRARRPTLRQYGLQLLQTQNL